MLNCREVTRLLSESLDRPLTLKERVGVNIHLMMCKGCKNCGEHLHELRVISRAYAKRSGDETG